MKKVMVLVFVLSVMLLPGNLRAQERKQWELSLGGRFFWGGYSDNTPLFVMLSVGRYSSKYSGFEISGFMHRGGVVLDLNLKIGLFDGKIFVPFVTGGLWTVHTLGAWGWNYGGGLKIRLTRVFGIRTEYRRNSGLGWGQNAIFGAISVDF